MSRAEGHPLLDPSLKMPDLSSELMAQFTPENLLLNRGLRINPSKIRSRLVGEDVMFMGVDLGGDRAKAQVIRINHGQFERVGPHHELPSKNGAGYFDFLQKMSAIAEREGVDVGMSWAGPVRDGIPVLGPNMRVLDEECGGDIRQAIPQLVDTKNDAEAALVATAVRLAMNAGDRFQYQLLPILGGGFGYAALVSVEGEEGEMELIGTEAGHLALVPSLNSSNRTTTCELAAKLLGKNHPCLEMVASGGGMEAIAREVFGREVKGPEISELARLGDERALQILLTAVTAVSQATVGLMRALDIPADPQRTVVVGHGGVFKNPYVTLRQKAATAEYLGLGDQMLPTYTTFQLVSQNAGEEGAALGAYLATR